MSDTNVFVSKVTSRGQITLPSEFRAQERITGRDYVIMRKLGESIVVTKLATRLDEITSAFERMAKSKGLTKAKLLSELAAVRRKKQQG